MSKSYPLSQASWKPPAFPVQLLSLKTSSKVHSYCTFRDSNVYPSTISRSTHLLAARAILPT